MDKRNLIFHEVIGGLLLLSCAVLALAFNNSPLSTFYNYFLDIRLSIEFNDVGLDKPLLLWINDGLMAVFFLLVGLELKREIFEGELSDFKQLSLPVAGAFGGMLVPILIYLTFNAYNPDFLIGWATPMATDIAFALGMLALFGKRVPIELRLFLLTLAIIDDLGAIMVIGIFHTEKISVLALTYALSAISGLLLLNRLKIRNTTIYMIFGVILWVSTLESGFHATLAGVLLAFTMPMKIKHVKENKSLLHVLENDLRPWVMFFILPVFAFANSGIPFNNLSLVDFGHPIVLGIALGLLFGNLLGVTAFTLLIRKILNVRLPFSNSNLVGVALLCGIGFTMSLFIGVLSFNHDTNLLNLCRLGIMTGSFVSMVLGMMVLYYTLPE